MGADQGLRFVLLEALWPTPSVEGKPGANGWGGARVRWLRVRRLRGRWLLGRLNDDDGGVGPGKAER